MEIYSRMIKILQDIDCIKKDKTNSMQNYKFRGIDDMYNALHELFAKHEVFICSDVLELTREERQTAKGGNLIYTVLKIKFTFQTVDGSNVESIMIGEAMDSGDKSANKAMSTALKYALMQAFLIPTEDLNDSDKDTYPESNKKEPEKKEIKKEYPTVPKLTEKFYKSWELSNKPFEIFNDNLVNLFSKDKSVTFQLTDAQVKQCNIYIQQMSDLYAIEETKNKLIGNTHER